MLELLIAGSLMGAYMMRVRKDVLRDLEMSGKNVDRSWL
jgi:hypothetical protein